MAKLFGNIRFYVLVFSSLLASGYYLWVMMTIPLSTTRTIILTQLFALTAITYLYFALLATPLTRIFPQLPFRGYYVKARRAIGVSAFFFAVQHAYMAFFDQLGGFDGLPFLPGKYLIAITLSATALTILTLMAMTSFDFMIAKLTHKRWKFLHRFVYMAGLFIVIHALLLGSHFQDFSSVIPQIFIIALTFLLILETIRFFRWAKSKAPTPPPLGGAKVAD